MRRFFCLLLTLLIPFAALAESGSDWAVSGLPQKRLPEYIETVPWDEIRPTGLGQHHYLLLCIDRWESVPRPADAPSVPAEEGRGKDNYGNTDGIVILTLDTASHRIMLTSIIRDAIVLKPGRKGDNMYFDYGRINYVYNDSGPEALCRLISEHLGIRIEKYILFNFSQIQDIIDLPSLDGVDIELNKDEITYLARFAVPLHSVTKADGYYAAYGDPLNLHYVSKSRRPLDFRIPASVFSADRSGNVIENVSFDGVDGSSGSSVTFYPDGSCKVTLPDGSEEKSFYSYEYGRLAVMTGDDVHLNELAPAGLYHMKGHSALLYMRMRKGAHTDTDFMRTQRVRNVLTALADKCRTFSLDQANDLANSIMQHNDTTNMSLKEMTDAAAIAYSLRDCTVEEFRVPTEGDVRSITFGNMSADEINWPAVRKKHMDFIDHTTLVYRNVDFVVNDDD